MKKFKLFILCVIFLLNFSLVAASPVDIEINPTELDVKQNKFAVFNFKITNNQDRKDSFLISFDGPHLEWKMPGHLLTVVEPNSFKELKIIFYPDDVGRYSYTVTVSSFFNPDVRMEKTIYLNVIPQAVAIKSFDVNVDEKLNAEVVLISSEETEVSVEIAIKDASGKIVKFFTYSEVVDGVKKLVKHLPVDDLLAGEYSIIVKVDEDVKERKFYVDPVHNILEITKTIPGPLYDEIIISVENQGNVIEYDYGHKEEVKADAFTGFVTKPRNCFTADDKMVCDFVISELKPGEVKEIIYRIEHWPIYVRYAAGILIIAILILFSYPKATQPKIKKTYIKKKKSEHRIIIEVKNPFKEVKSVIIRDFVSPLAKVVHEFEHIKPIVKKSEAGTELIWKIGRMKPKEVRVLSYKIKSLVEGNLKMPKAYLRFRDDKGRRIRVYSGHLIIE
jgi:hypothetical protein